MVSLKQVEMVKAETVSAAGVGQGSATFGINDNYAQLPHAQIYEAKPMDAH